MNRLVIIGNGFDLAHGLPTSYKHFIDDYWRGIKDSNHNDEFVSFVFKTKVEFENIKNIDCISKQFIALDEKVKFSEAEIYYEFGNNILTGKHPRDHILVYKNDFFKLINQKSVENWVDIENEYFRLLKEIVKSKCLDVSKSKEYWVSEQKKYVEKLNSEFEQVKIFFEIYLNKIDKPQTTNKSILDYFKFINVESDNYFLEFPKQDQQDLEEFRKDYVANRDFEVKSTTYCLNFNYTPTIDNYINDTRQYGNDRVYGRFENLQIHGNLNDINNKINFGFGDEMDEDYKVIENLNDNEYLRNFKSFQYLQNSNYKALLDFIDSEKFQVFIMGHSCGLSDRTLLNTVFEHNNCRSIKVFYHQRENGTDNYTEIIQNISRHFDDKKLMREKIVNKMLCKHLPQIQ